MSLISQPKHILWVQLFGHPKQMFQLIDKKIITILLPQMLVDLDL